MNISVIITYVKGDQERQDGLLKLFDCIKRQTFRDFELILAEMTLDGTTVYTPYKPDQHLVLNYKGIFNKSWVSNVAARKAKYDLLLSLDADVVFDEDYFQAISDYYEKYKNEFFVPWDKCIMGVGRDEPTERIVTGSYMRAAARAWCVMKDFYWKVGGMNEKYFGYGAEDQDMFFRAEHIMKIVTFMPCEIRHTYHHFHPKDSSFPLNMKRVELLEQTKADLQGEIDRLVLNIPNLKDEEPYVIQPN
jgi:glycosyltransferase involved in cell wall biosynthesis